MNREQYQSAFVSFFAASDPSPIRNGDLARIEEELETLFPHSFLEFATKIGSVFTPSILELVTGRESENRPPEASFDVHNFFGADEIIEATKTYRVGGMNVEMIAVASDSMGNVFGFKQDKGPHRSDDAPLLVFDHDFCSLEIEASSFDLWILSFLKMRELVAETDPST